MKSKHEPIEWLEKARLDIYERTKDMTSEERVEYINSSALRFAREQGLIHVCEQLSRP